MMMYWFNLTTKEYITETEDHGEEWRYGDQNWTRIPPDIAAGKKAFFDENDSIWLYADQDGCMVDPNGVYVQPITSLHDLVQSTKHNQYVPTSPEKESSEYIFHNNRWKYLPKPPELLSPKFDKDKGSWIEGATQSELNTEVDIETSRKIKDWCRENEFAEEQLLFKAIEDKDDPDYLKYKQAKQEIIEEQRKKKK